MKGRLDNERKWDTAGSRRREEKIKNVMEGRPRK